MKKILFYSGIGGAIAIIISTYAVLVNARRADLSYALPTNLLQAQQQINQCYPSTFHSPDELRYAESSDGYRYYEAIAKFRGQSTDKYTTLYLRTKNEGCKWLNRNDWQSGRLKFMPEQTAIAIAKLRYEQVVKQCEDSLPKNIDPKVCIKQLEQAINQPTNWDAVQIDYLFPDDAAALKEMDVVIDKVLVVDSIQDLEKKKKVQREMTDELARYSRGNSKKVSRVLRERVAMPTLTKTP